MAVHEHKDKLRRFIDNRGEDFLRDPNVTSIGIGRKDYDPAGPISIVFTVERKVDESEMAALGTAMLPREIMVEGTPIPTDVQVARYNASHQIVKPEIPGWRTRRHDPVMPGISVGHRTDTKGTLGAIVFDERTGLPCMLSNWHVLNTQDGRPSEDGGLGSPILQPSAKDDMNLANNVIGMLLRGTLGKDGDAALALIANRTVDPMIHGLGVAPARMADVDLEDTVVKSGLVSGITYGIVRRVDVLTKIDLRLASGPVIIGGFDIAPDPARKPSNGEISEPGDSGAVWMIHEDGVVTDIMAGLHCAGETAGNTDEHAIANYPLRIQSRLGFRF